ncbi:aminotransferase class III-fold pyridoxal phosphate-dependent enzyme [Photorhabdus africana]|uniref:aminotransferase class III-fold pyridoxal phosphate-dependent enzyme n=1 Tax=Photorhabdus africana TaxID=3097554 RepID=UPI002B40ACED|nr:aminotransferase class III-fold pyridoxal phosphate-dependent enzyme [Photorhabdus sp. CRI-LC]
MTTLLSDYSRFVNQGWAEMLNALGASPVFLRAEGDRLYDSDDNVWFDFIGHYGATLFGHGFEPLKTALKRSLDEQIPAGAPLGITALAPRLAKMLIERLELRGNWNNWTLSTGAEAVEAALKIAVSSTGRRKVLARRGAFHGLTTFTLQLTDHTLWRQGYEILTESDIVDFFDDAEEGVQQIASAQYAALLVEPVQAIAGGRILSAFEASALREACTYSGTLFITDEVFSGMGRCGAYSAMQALGWQTEPDMILLSKTLTGGLVPSAQLVVRQTLFSEFTLRPGCSRLLASTFAGNPLGQTVALEVLTILDRVLLDPAFGQQQACFAAQLGELARAHPSYLVNVVSLTNLHFLRFASTGLAWKVWRYLHANRILTTICSHRPDTLKLICALNQTTESQNALCDVIQYVCEEVGGV